MKKTEAGDDSSEQTNPQSEIFLLQLFVTGASPNSVRAIENVKKICESYLAGRYELEIIDVYQQPLIAQNEQVIALPMLVKNAPKPFKRLIGDMSDLNKVIRSLDLNHSEHGI